VAPKEHHSLRERASFALRRPDLLSRRILGKGSDIHLDEVAPYLTGSPVILEAGACDGTDTLKLAQRWPGASIYAFEPVPELFAEVERRTGHLRPVRRYPMALSDRTGSATLNVAGDPNDERSNRGMSSLFLRKTGNPEKSGMPAALWDYFSHPLEVQTITIADWAHGEGVERIDFMWLDMEGMEMPVLRAAGPVLATTRAICMEVTREERYPSGCALYDEIVAWMKGQGFRPAIDRVMQWYGNILFVRY
jgi:2-O-methyltransferase